VRDVGIKGLPVVGGDLGPAKARRLIRFAGHSWPPRVKRQRREYSARRPGRGQRGRSGRKRWHH
jgi:hypothetical protein